jgi:hypothetical protein
MNKKITNKTLIKQLNKKYNSVEVDGVFYWFDDEIKGEKGCNYNFGLNNIDNLPKYYPEHSTEWNFCRKIIAQSQNKLEGVPTILLMNYSSEQILEQINSISVIELDEEFNIISYE